MSEQRPANYAAVGQALMMFVPREVWVTANFKETQLLSVRPGDPVDIRVDTYPHRVFKGHVDSIQAGSGRRDRKAGLAALGFDREAS